MAAKCPSCGEKLHWYDFRAECRHCGANIPNYDWENRLEADADAAEDSFARLHYRVNNFKSATVGSPLRIVRLVCTLLPLVALVVPLLNATFAFPFREGTESISFLTFVMGYLVEYDLGSVIKLMSGEIMGSAFQGLLLSVLMAMIAVVAGVLNFFVVLLGAINLRWLFNVILNCISLVTWGLSALFLSQFTAATADLSLGLFSGSVSPFYLVGIGLFLLDLVIDIVVGISLKKQKATQPNIEEAVAIELKALREEQLAEAAQMA